MAQAPVDIKIKVSGDSQIDKLQKRMKGLESGITGVNSKLPQATNNIRNVGRAAGTATGNIQRMGVAFRSTVAPIVAAYAAINFFGKSLNTFGRREADVALLTNGLKKLGGTESDLAKLTKQANAFGNSTLFDQEDFTAGAGLLTSFSDVAIKDYQRVIDISADLAQTNKGAVKDSLLQVAKALNDPVANLTALSRSGIQFSETQKDVVKALVNTGQKAEAQSIILAELEKQYGGNAVAAATGLQGAQDSLSEAFRDFQEVVGEGVLPVVTDFIKGATDIFTALSKLNPKVIETAAKAVTLAAKMGLVALALKGVIALKAGIIGVLTSTATSTALAGNASAVAAVKINTMAASLLRLAGIGIVTVGVNFLINGFQSGGRQEDLLKGLESGAFDNTLQNLPYEQAQAALRAEEKTLTDLLVKRDELQQQLKDASGGFLSLIPGIGPMRVGAKKGELNEVRLQIQKSQRILSSATQAPPKATEDDNPFNLENPTLTSNGGGAAAAAAAAPLTDDLKGLQGQLDLLQQIKPIQDEINASRIIGNEDAVRENEAYKEQLELIYQQQTAVDALNTAEGKSIQLQINQLELERLKRDTAAEDAIAQRDKAKAMEDALRPLQEQRQILEGILDGRGEEVRLNLEIERLMRQFPDLERSKVAELVKGNAQLEEQIAQAAELEQLYAQIGQRVASGLVDGITAAIDGTKSLQEVLADVLKDVGKMFLQFGIKSAFGGLGLPGFADGGFVSGPTAAVVGEGGESEYIIPASKMNNAMSNYSMGKRGGSVIDDPASGGRTQSGGGEQTYRLETTVINNIEYATVDQVRAMGSRAAKQGAAEGNSKTMSSLRNSRSQRSKLGLGR